MFRAGADVLAEKPTLEESLNIKLCSRYYGTDVFLIMVLDLSVGFVLGKPEDLKNR